MDITNVTKLGTSRISESIRVSYTISSKGDEIANSLTASIFSDDEIVGFCNADKNGGANFSFVENNGFTEEQMNEVIGQIISYVSQVFTAPDSD